jgi:hypothetical protein
MESSNLTHRLTDIPIKTLENLSFTMNSWNCKRYSGLEDIMRGLNTWKEFTDIIVLLSGRWFTPADVVRRLVDVRKRETPVNHLGCFS